MPTLSRLSLFGLFVLSLGLLAPQAAQARYACEVKRTADGFVALREGPGAASKMKARMKRGELVGLLHPPDFENLVRKGDWLFVIYYPGVKHVDLPKTDTHKAKSINGWVHDRLIDCKDE